MAFTSYSKTSKSFLNAKECCEYFRNLYNKKFKTAYELPQLKAKSDIFNDLKEGLDFAIKNAEELDLDENSNPYTNMHKVISELLKMELCNDRITKLFTKHNRY